MKKSKFIQILDRLEETIWNVYSNGFYYFCTSYNALYF